MKKKQLRFRRAMKSRINIKKLNMTRLLVHRTNLHIYASIICPSAKILVTSSTLEKKIREQLLSQSGKGGNIKAAILVGKCIAKKALHIGISKVAFDRSGFRYHGRVRALAESARQNGLQF